MVWKNYAMEDEIFTHYEYLLNLFAKVKVPTFDLKIQPPFLKKQFVRLFFFLPIHWLISN